MKIVIGIDPDSDKHGVSFFADGTLTNLKSMRLMELADWIRSAPEHHNNITIHIEDVCANNAAFHKKGVANSRAATNINRSIGKCQQSQVEIERAAEYLGVEVIKHKISKQWKDAKAGKAMFERITGWTGRSNEDTRSAAYFGYLGCK